MSGNYQPMQIARIPDGISGCDNALIDRIRVSYASQ